MMWSFNNTRLKNELNRISSYLKWFFLLASFAVLICFVNSIIDGIKVVESFDIPDPEINLEQNSENVYGGHDEDMHDSDSSNKIYSNFNQLKPRKYILYDVNHGEGFNLRRDVYMRIANLVRLLREKGENFILVLPPHGMLYHWQSNISEQVKIPWSTFFDLRSLNRFVPVVEFEQYLIEMEKPIIEYVFYLQTYQEGWVNGHWEEKFHRRPCIQLFYEKDSNSKTWHGWFFGYKNFVSALNVECISIQGQSSTLIPLILEKNQSSRSIMIDRAETILHDHFGDVYFWQARRSMRYAKRLRDEGDRFREAELNSTDDLDQTLLTDDWRQMEPKHGTALGGPFLCVHWRRKDFIWAHGAELPSIVGTANQIRELLQKLELHTVFLATDAPSEDIEELRSHLPSMIAIKRYLPSSDADLLEFKDGGVSIIDQWICAHARYFTGSHVSTFSYRIQEDREILGFDPNTTFNRMCPDDNSECEQPAKWTIKFQ